MTFAELPIREFADEIAGGSATPGGGSTAAIAAATGAALVEMGCNLTIGRDGFEDVSDELTAVREDLERRRERLYELADEDSAAFDEVMAAYGMDEGPERSKAIQDATRTATTVPLETAEECLAVLEHAATVSENGNPNVVTDAGTGGLLAHAALQAALYNVEINLGGLDDDSFVTEVADRIEEIEANGEATIQQLQETVAQAI